MVTKYQCLRSISDASFDSDLSNDYAIPPDASTMSSLAPLPSTPSRILMSQDNISSACNSPARKGTQAFNNAEKALEKSGYLTKLGGKIKSWRKRYFVLKNGTLSYWKSQVSLINIRSTHWEIFISFEPICVHSQIWSPEMVNFLTLRMWEGKISHGGNNTLSSKTEPSH